MPHKSASRKTISARRKPVSRHKSAARRTVSSRKSSKRPNQVARHKAQTAKHKKPAKKPVLKKPVKAALKARAEKQAAKKPLPAAKAGKQVAVKLAVAKPVQPKIVGTMLARPHQPAPIVKQERFSTTASPAKAVGNTKIGYKVNEYVVYPTHGVGQIVSIEEQIIAGMKIELFVVFFAKDRMTLRVPVTKIASVGMRKISESGLASKAMETLKGRPRIKRTMWSRRAQEYEAKINSGDLIAVAEVVRDLYRADTQPEQSYSERQLFEAALARLVGEIAAVNKASESEATQLVMNALQKGPRRRAAAAVEENVVQFKKKADNDDGDSPIEEQAA